METLILAILIVLLFIVGFSFLDGLPREFSYRSCQGRFWRRAFPSASKEEMRRFLSLFVEAFAFKDEHRLKFNPEDGLWQIYKALYPESWMPDGLEFETLSMMLEEKYGFQLNHIWHDDLSLGELFMHTQRV